MAVNRFSSLMNLQNIAPLPSWYEFIIAVILEDFNRFFSPINTCTAPNGGHTLYISNQAKSQLAATARSSGQPTPLHVVSATGPKHFPELELPLTQIQRVVSRIRDGYVLGDNWVPYPWHSPSIVSKHHFVAYAYNKHVYQIGHK